MLCYFKENFWGEVGNNEQALLVKDKQLWQSNINKEFRKSIAALKFIEERAPGNQWLSVEGIACLGAFGNMQGHFYLSHIGEGACTGAQ